MSDLREEIELLQKPFQDVLDGLYESQEEDEIDHSSIRDELESLLDEKFSCLGYLNGVINGAGISWTLDLTYYVPSNPMSDGKTWVMFALWYDDNWNRWQFNDCGRMELGMVSEERAAYELLKKYAEPGSDRESIEDCEDLIEEWRCAAEGLPRPESRREVRIEERTNIMLDFLSPDRPSERDAKFTDEEMTAVLHALVMVAKADDVLESKETELLRSISRDLAVNHAYVERISEMMTSKAIPVFLFKILGGLKNMREAKKIWLAQYMHIMGVVDGDHDEREKEIWVTVCHAIGIGGQGGIDPFRDLPAMRLAANNVDKAWSYAPSCPFMPCSVECLDHGDGSGPITAVNGQGVLIIWMKLVGFPNRIDVRLAHREGEFILQASLTDGSSDECIWKSPDQPRFGDIMCLLIGGHADSPITEVQSASPLGRLLGGGMEVRNWNPKDLGGIVTKRVEFDDDEQADGKGILSKVFGRKARRILEYSCNYHVPPGSLVRFLEGKVPSGVW